MKKTLLLASFGLFFSFSFAQQGKIDSLINKIKIQPQSLEKAHSLSELCNLMVFSSPINEAKPYLDELILLSKKFHNDSLLSNSYQLYGGFYTHAGDLINVEKYMKKAIHLSDSVKDAPNYILSTTSLAAMYGNFNRNKLQLQTLENGLDYIDANKLDIPESCHLYLGLGNYFMGEEDQDKALEYYLKSLRCADKFKRLDVIAGTTRGLAWIYYDREDFEKAEKYLLLGIETAEEARDPYVKALLERILGKVYTEVESFEEALQRYYSSLDFFTNINSRFHLIELPNNLATTYFRMGNYKKSLKYSEDALVRALKFEDTLLINASKLGIANCSWKLLDFQRSNRLLSEISSDTINKERWPSYVKSKLYLSLYLNNREQGNYKQALKSLENLKRFEDSIKKGLYNIRIVDIETKYQSEKKENENLALKQQNAEQALLMEKDKNQKLAIGSGLAVALAGLGIFFVAYRKNQKQKKEIEKQKNLVEDLQRELHHRLKNNLSFIDFFITLAKGKFPDPAYREKLEELQNRINSMFEVHKQLFKKEDVTSVNAKTYISALVENVKKTYAVRNITLEENIDDTNLRADTSFPIGLIINEFVTNSYKYAFPDNREGVISVDFTETADHYLLKLKDNGQGLPENFNIDALDSFGMETIKLLTQEYKGSFILDGSDGLRMEITFPKNAA